MPNYLGILTKQEAKELRDLNLSGHGEKIREIASLIEMAQKFSFNQTEITINMVVHTDVEKYFKNIMAYTTIQDITGQPANFTLLIKISWA